MAQMPITVNRRTKHEATVGNLCRCPIGSFVRSGWRDRGFDLVFHWDFVAGQWRDSGRGHLPTRKSTSEPRRGIVLFARQCVVGSSVVDLRGLLLCPVRAKADIESGAGASGE
jgi:hypothetical protein